MADGSPLNTLGEVEFEVQIGEQWFPMTAVVAELEIMLPYWDWTLLNHKM